MIRVLFVCHGNICRSTMAQFVFQDMVNKAGLSGNFHIDSAATSREEIGNPVIRGRPGSCGSLASAQKESTPCR